MSHYKALGVSRTASTAEIKKAYRGLVRQYHPDAPGGSAEKMAAINAAYGVLNHPDKKSEYDKGLGGGGRPAAPSASTPPKTDAKPAASPPPPARPAATTPTPRPTSSSPSRPAAGARTLPGGRGSGAPLVRRPTAGPVARPTSRPSGPTRPPQPPTAPPAAPTPSAAPARPSAPTARPQRFGGGISGLHTAQFGHLRSAGANGGQRQPWIRRSTAEERTGGAGRFTVTPLFNVVNAQNPGPFADVRANPERYASARMTPMQRDAVRAKRDAEQTKATNSAETKRAREEGRATRASEREGRRQSRQTFRVNSQMQKERMQRMRRWLNTSEAGPRAYSADTRHVDPVQPRYDSPPALPAGRGRRSRAK